MTDKSALCGVRPFHGIRSCRECRRLYARQWRARQHKDDQRWGFQGPECLECGGIKSAVQESGYTDAGQRIRRRECLDCGQSCASVEVYIDPLETTFWRLNGERARRKLETAYQRRGKGAYRLTNRRAEPDEVWVTVNVIKRGLQSPTKCYRGHPLVEANVYRGPRGEYRECLTCRRARHETRKAA